MLISVMFREKNSAARGGRQRGSLYLSVSFDGSVRGALSRVVGDHLGWAGAGAGVRQRWSSVRGTAPSVSRRGGLLVRVDCAIGAAWLAFWLAVGLVEGWSGRRGAPSPSGGGVRVRVGGLVLAAALRCWVERECQLA